MTRGKSSDWAREAALAEIRARQRAGGAPRPLPGRNLAVPCADIAEVNLEGLLVVDGLLLDRGVLQALIREALHGPTCARKRRNGHGPH
jgi:hypothetical protein